VHLRNSAVLCDAAVTVAGHSTKVSAISSPPALVIAYTSNARIKPSALLASRKIEPFFAENSAAARFLQIKRNFDIAFDLHRNDT
jgi:hypothetical protein